MSCRRLAYPTLIVCLATTSASADITVDDVWSDWTANIESFGYSYSANETRDGNVLTVSDFSLSSTAPEGTGEIEITFDQIVFSENSDGTVSIVLPAVSPLKVTMEPEGDETVVMAMNIVQDKLQMTASGTPAALTYTYSADSIGVKTTQIEVDGQVLPSDTNLFDARLLDVTGQTDILLDSMRRQTQTMQVSSLSYTFRLSEPDTNQQVDATAIANNMQFSGTSATPLRVVQADNMSAMLDAGFELDGTFTVENGSSEITSVGPEGPFAGQFTVAGGTLDVALGQDGLTYAGTQNGLTAKITSSGIPIPLDFSAEEAAFNLKMPLRKSEAAQDFGFGVTLGGFSMSDVLWGLFDPTAQLPRDPATIILDLAGKGRLLFDFLDPEAASVSGNPNITPAEVDALDINKLQIEVAGAELSGTGTFVFDNSAGGAPKPIGGADLMLVGGNALLDKLVSIGIVPQEQATGVRLMMGLLAVPGPAPDTMNSRLEINDQGHILANGQRIQ